MTRFAFIFILITNFCFGQDDYSITNSLTQKITLKNIEVVEIKCYCPNGINVIETTKATASQNLTLNVKATESSVGYHGKQQKPNKIKEAFLKFIIQKEGNTLKIISNEWTFMHHAFIINSLNIYAPKGIKYKLIKIPGNKLEGRRNVF